MICFIYFIMKDNKQGKGKHQSLKLIEVDPQTINKNQLNSSSSKMQYSIPKEKRWISAKQDNTKFYDIPDTKSKRGASFGYGNKISFGEMKSKAPSVGVYDLKSEFVSDKHKGITIAAGRQIVKNNSVFDDNKKQLPGPGKYTIEDQNPKNARKGYTLSGRNVDLTDKWRKSVPGPGNYETLELLDKNLKSSNSKFANVPTGKFSKNARKSDFQQKMGLNFPAPNSYNSGQTDKTAKFPAKGGYKFSNSSREGIVPKEKVKLPGPGSYKHFSQFIH